MVFSVYLMAMLVVGSFAAPRHSKDILDCHGRPSELFFLLDSSTSIWPVNFTKQLEFVNDVIDVFNVSPTHTRVAVGSFSYRFMENFNLKRYDNKADVKMAVSEILQMFGGTYTNDALDGIRKRGLGNQIVRPGVVRIAFVITDGQSHNEKKTRVAATKLKNEGITVFAVGIGKSTDREELRAIASEPSEKFVFNVGNFDLLKTIQEELAMSACAVQLQDEPTLGPVCGAENPADVIFVADSSHLSSARIVDVFDFIANATEDFNTETGNIQVGIESRYCGSGNMKLGRFKAKEDLVQAVRKTKHSSLHHLLKHLGNQAYKEENGGRNEARHMAVVFVDDKLGDTSDIIEQAELAKRNDIELFVVAIGDKVNDKELKNICSSAKERHYIKVDSYDDLKNIKEDFLSKFCHGL